MPASARQYGSRARRGFRRCPRPRSRTERKRKPMPRFFIDRPIFAWVLAIGIMLGGLLALRALPIEQYPSIAPPSLTISTNYPGADASTLEKNVTSVIEQELNGVE